MVLLRMVLDLRVRCLLWVLVGRLALCLLLLLLVIKTAHTGQGERVRRRSGRTLTVVVDGLSSRGGIAVLRRGRVPCRRTLWRVVVRSGRWVAHCLRAILVLLVMVLLVLARMASGRLRMGHGRRGRGGGGGRARRMDLDDRARSRRRRRGGIDVLGCRGCGMRWGRRKELGVVGDVVGPAICPRGRAGAEFIVLAGGAGGTVLAAVAAAGGAAYRLWYS